MYRISIRNINAILNKEKLILSLIKDDLINTKLVSGLKELGLYSDRYYLNLSSTIFELMGFTNSAETDIIFNRYLELSDEVLSIDTATSNQPVEKLALTIYRKLKKASERRLSAV